MFVVFFVFLAFSHLSPWFRSQSARSGHTRGLRPHISQLDPETKEEMGEREEHEEHDEHEELRDSRTHTNPIHPILTPVARWTTPIESPGRGTRQNSRREIGVGEEEIGEGERVACTRISLNNIQINNQGCLDYRGMIP